MASVDGKYQVARSTGRCEATGTALEAGSPCVAALCDEPEEGGFRRLDFSIEAWEQGARPEGLFSFWRTTVPEPNTKKRLLVDDEVLLVSVLPLPVRLALVVFCLSSAAFRLSSASSADWGF